MRFAKAQNESDLTNNMVGPTSASAYIRSWSGHNCASTSITCILKCAAADKIGVLLWREAQQNNGTSKVTARYRESNFMVEYVYSA